jgi:hypothetical protein
MKKLVFYSPEILGLQKNSDPSVFHFPGIYFLLPPCPFYMIILKKLKDLYDGFQLTAWL